MPIKPYFPTSPPLRATHVGAVNTCPRRISALIIEEDLSDIDSSDSSWFLPATTYETITISQKGPVPAPAVSHPDVHNVDVPTAADTSRRPSICLARLQTQFQDDGDINIHLPNYDGAVHSPCSFQPGSPARKRVKSRTQSRRGSSSEVYFHSPLRRFHTFSRSNSASSASSGSVSSSGSSSAASGYESPVFYPDECGCNDLATADKREKECEISKTASSMPIRVPGSAKRRRRGCFVQEDVSPTEDDESMSDDSSVDDFVQFAYIAAAPNSTFETALISEVVRRRQSDERFASLKNHGAGYEYELENAQFFESHRRSEWMRDMVRFYPQECGGGHMLPCF
ncbi:hypothetical protein ABW21_db0202647 [Orbilia brochopaga]|nr:hypothetical protein ABW21_db0202647 [Drechslerella brochopaga]